MEYDNFQETVKTTIHELFHVMGFTEGLFDKFLDYKGNKYSEPIAESYTNERG